MFKKILKRVVDNEGSALFAALVLAMVMATVLAALSVSSITRSNIAEGSNSQIDRTYAAQAGLERLKLEIMSDIENAATNLQDHIAAHGEDGAMHVLNIGATEVETFVQDLGTDLDPWFTWYLVRARATDPAKNVTEIALACKLVDSFGRYALFVDGTLGIGDFARYVGAVHANGDVEINGHHITFEEDLTAHGDIEFGDEQARTTVTFFTDATSGVPEKVRPGALDIAAMGENPPDGSVVYDWDNEDFKTRFLDITGSPPNDTLETYVTFNTDTMNVITTCTVDEVEKIMNETLPVPNDNVIYVRSDVHLVGHLSRRVSVLTPEQVYIEGPIRYVDDSDEPQYILYKKQGGIANFDEPLDMWRPVVNWQGGNFDYREADDWADRVPEIAGEPQNPTLGVIAGSDIWINNTGDFPKNVEIHGMMYSAEGVVRPVKEWDPNGHNLGLFGSRIQVGSSPNSDAWHFRHYMYDENLLASPPPGFPTMLDPSFSNWHIIQER